MKTRSPLVVVSLLAALALGSCRVADASRAPDDGTLLVIGGGLDNDTAPIYRRFVELAAERGTPNIVIVSAATGPQEEEITDKTEALRVWAPSVPVSAVRRETSTEETVARIDAATALLFTGGDQQRITDRYRPAGAETPEWLAMRRLLARGGVIAGCSAGDAMMGDAMLLGGSSAAALGIESAVERGEGAPPLGPRTGLGMGFLPWAITDSHFFERERVGRLVAAQEALGIRLGIGVGEDACVEVDLGTGELRGVGVSESLVVDVSGLARDGLRRTNLRARVLGDGECVSLRAWLARPAGRVLTPPEGGARVVPVAEPGQNRQLALWRLFRTAEREGEPLQRLALEGFEVLAWPAGDGEVAFELAPRAR